MIALLCVMLLAGLLPQSAHANDENGGIINGMTAWNGNIVYYNGVKWKAIAKTSDGSAWLLFPVNGLDSKSWTSYQAMLGYGDTYYNGLSDGEKSAILPTTKSDPKYEYSTSLIYNTDAGLDKAKMFPLSAQEAYTYIIYKRTWNKSPWPYKFLLRSQCTNGNAGWVDSNIALSSYQTNAASGQCIRLVFQLDRTKVLFESDATKEKPSSSADGEFGVFNAPNLTNDPSKIGAKLTLIVNSSEYSLDSRFTAAVDKTQVAKGKSLKVTYSGVSDGNYVSAILLDASGAVLKHANKTPDESGEWDLTIPTDLDPGSYTLKLYSEKQNGAYKTDYASTPVEFALTVTGGSTPATVTEAPTKNTLTYDGTEQNLVTAGTADGGTMQYALGVNATEEPVSGWTDTISTCKDYGTYYVWYRASGDEDHTNSAAACIPVSIGKKTVTVSGIKANDKPYDMTTDATFDLSNVVFNGIAEGDTLTVTVYGKFVDAERGENKTVTITSLSLGGASVGNYQLASSGNQTTATATISLTESASWMIGGNRPVWGDTVYFGQNDYGDGTENIQSIPWRVIGESDTAWVLFSDDLKGLTWPQAASNYNETGKSYGQ